MKITDKKIYLLVYDNNGQYEDHYTTPLCVASTKKKAEKFAAECNDWIAKANEEKPKWDHDKEGETIEEWNNRINAFRKYFQELNPVFPELKEDMEYNKGGRVYVIEMPVVK